MSTPSQLGSALLVSAAPTFTNYIVPADTWQPSDTTELTVTKQENGSDCNYSFQNKGEDVSATLIPKSGASLLEKGDVISGNNSRKYIVAEVRNVSYGNFRIAQEVTLHYRESMNGIITANK